MIAIDQARRGVDSSNSVVDDDVQAKQRRVGKIVSPLIHKYLCYAVSSSIIDIKIFYSLVLVTMQNFGFISSISRDENGIEEDKNCISLLSNFVPILIREMVAISEHFDKTNSTLEQQKDYKNKDSTSYLIILLDLLSLFLNYVEVVNSISTPSLMHSVAKNIESCSSILTTILLNKNVVYFITYSLYLLQYSPSYDRNLFHADEITRTKNSWKRVGELVNILTNTNASMNSNKSNYHDLFNKNIIKRAISVITNSVSLLATLFHVSLEEKEHPLEDMEIEEESASSFDSLHRRSKIIKQIIEIYSDSKWNQISSTIEKSHIQHILNSNSDNQYYPSIGIGFIIEEECISKKVNRKIEESASQFLRIAKLSLLSRVKLFSELWISAWRSLFYYYTVCYQISASNSLATISIESETITNSNTSFSQNISSHSNPQLGNALRSYMLRKAYLCGKVNHSS